MPKERKTITPPPTFGRIRNLGKILLIAAIVFVTAGAAGSYTINICPGCNQQNLIPYTPELAPTIRSEEHPKAQEKSDGSRSDVSSMP